MTFPQPKQNFARVDSDGILSTPYVDENQVALTCDVNGRLWVSLAAGSIIIAQNTLKASSDGTTGLTPVVNGAQQQASGDLYGREWVRLYQADGVNPGAIRPGTGLYIQGAIGTNVASTGTLPVLVSGSACEPYIGLSSVGAFDRAQYVALDVNGRVVTRTQGWLRHDEQYIPDNMFPVVVGGNAVQYYQNQNLVSDAGDVVKAAYSMRGEAFVATNARANPAQDGSFYVTCSARGGALVTAFQIFNDKGRLRRLTVCNNSAEAEARVFILLFQQNSVPGGGENPFYSVGWCGVQGGGTATGNSIDLEFTAEMYFNEGCAVAASKEAYTYSPIGDLFVFSALYVT